MSKLSNLSDKDIHELIEAMQNGIAVKPVGEEAEALKVSISRAYAELERRAQKKSDPQLSGFSGWLPDREQQIERENKAAWYEEKRVQNQATDKEQSEKAFENKGWEKVREALPVMAKAYDEFVKAPQVAPKPTATIHFAGQQHQGQYTRGELWSDVRQNFKLVLSSATFRRCLSSCDYSELWSMVLFVKLWQGIHEGLKKLEGGKDYTMEELLIRHWTYGEDTKEAGRLLAEYLKQPKPQQ